MICTTICCPDSCFWPQLQALILDYFSIVNLPSYYNSFCWHGKAVSSEKDAADK